MNFLFTFGECVNIWVLADFQSFMEDLGVDSYCEVGNYGLEQELIESGSQEPVSRFPENYMIVCADTDDKDLLETISNKYTRLIAECPDIVKQDPAYGLDALQ